MRTFSKILGSVLAIVMILSALPMVSFAAGGSGSGTGCTYTLSSDGVLTVNCNDRIVNIHSAVKNFGSDIKVVNLNVSGVGDNVAVEIYGDDCDATALNVVGKTSGTFEKFSLFGFPRAYDVSIPTGVTFKMLRLADVGAKTLDNIKNIKVDYFVLKDCDYYILIIEYI